MLERCQRPGPGGCAVAMRSVLLGHGDVRSGHGGVVEAGLGRAGRTESKTKPLPKCARSAASHLALDEMISDFSIERSASCVPITYMSCSSGEAGSQGTSEAGGALPCMFHVPTKSRREASSGSRPGPIPLPCASPCGRSNGGVTAGENTGFALIPPFTEPKAAAVPFAGRWAGTVVGSATGMACDTAAGTGTLMGANGRKALSAIGAVWRGDGDHGEMAGIGESRARTGMDEADGARPTQGGSPGGGGGSCMCEGSAGGSVSSPLDCCSVALHRAASACGLAFRSKIASALSSGSSAVVIGATTSRTR